MLPFRLKQIKDILEEKKQTSELENEESELLNELNFLDKEIKIRPQDRRLSRLKLTEMIAPSPVRCPACGRGF